jgi:hypothetical protein
MKGLWRVYASEHNPGKISFIHRPSWCSAFPGGGGGGEAPGVFMKVIGDTPAISFSSIPVHGHVFCGWKTKKNAVENSRPRYFLFGIHFLFGIR